MVQNLLLTQTQAPGDVLMMTAAVRDLCRQYDDQFNVGVQTRYPELWEHNPWIVEDPDMTETWRHIEMHYPLVHRSNTYPTHFVAAYHQFLSKQLNLSIPPLAFKGDVHLSTEEIVAPPARWRDRLPERYWLLAPSTKKDFTAKWWNPQHWQQLIDLCKLRVAFVQVGSATDWPVRLSGVIDLTGETSIRELLSLVYHAQGVVTLVSFLMHLAAAVPIKPGLRPLRPCVVIAGGREPPHWEAYPGHQFLHRVGQLDCCQQGGCWRSRAQLVGDADRKDHRDLCEQPVQVSPDLRIARCMDGIWAEDVYRAICSYYSDWQRLVAP